MYVVNKLIHPRYGLVIHIERDANGSYQTPFQAVQGALKERRLWVESASKKVRILVDGQVMTPKQADHWAVIEYKSLPKCEGCAKILDGDIYTHQFSKDKHFCSPSCSDKDYLEEVEKINDEEEIDYL